MLFNKQINEIFVYGAQQDPYEFVERLLGTLLAHPNELSLKFVISGKRDLFVKDGDQEVLISSHAEHTFCLDANIRDHESPQLEFADLEFAVEGGGHAQHIEDYVHNGRVVPAEHLFTLQSLPTLLITKLGIARAVADEVKISTIVHLLQLFTFAKPGWPIC